MIFINRRNTRNNKPMDNSSFTPVTIMPISKLSETNNKIIKPVIKPRVKEMLWGEPTWFLFHTLAEKIKEEYYNNLKTELIGFIKNICSNLPCPDCAQHATRYVNGVNFSAINTKEQLKVFFYTFHNEVNKRKDYEIFKFPDIDKYKNAVTINIIKNFFYHFNKKSYSVRLDINGHQRYLLLNDFRKWLEKYSYCFDE